MTTAVPVAFVGGHGRSGSTLLSRVLGAAPGFVTVGELCYLWDQGVVMDRMCGCGQSFSGCEFWTAVGTDAFDGWDRVDARGLLTLRKSVERVRYTPLLSAPTLSPDYARKLREYAAAMSRVYPSVRTVSGAEVVVDTSKYPSSAYLLRHVPDVDLKLVHLVRSVYGVCYSWMKTVARPDRDGKPMPRYPPARTAAEWSAFNFLLDALRLRGVPTRLVHYEDFVATPREQLAAIVRFLGKEPSEAGPGVRGGVQRRAAPRPQRGRKPDAVPVRAGAAAAGRGLADPARPADPPADQRGQRAGDPAVRVRERRPPRS